MIDRFIRRVTARPPDRVIGGHDDPYMLRWYILPRNRLFNVYLHRFLRSDDDRAMHDHPFYNTSVLLRGSYMEHTTNGSFERSVCDVVFRRGVTLHRIELHKGPAWSLFVTSFRYREWGFACQKGWRHWKQFVDERDNGAIGRGCD